MTSHNNSSDEWSDDEWEDSPLSMVQVVHNVSWDTLSTFEYLHKGHKYYFELSETIELDNFGLTSGSQTVIHRCEPLKDNSGNKRYPTVKLPSHFNVYDKVILTMSLFHPNCGGVHVRFPDLKDKMQQCRGKNGLWVSPSNGPFRMKKKAIDKGTKRDTAFCLGGDFKFHTPGIEPCFVIVATPLENGVLATEKAIRSKPFLVRSKRQERPGPHKRRKKTRELNKLDTDIQAARREKETLQREDMRMSYVNSEHTRFIAFLRNKFGPLPEGPSKIALMHATRPIKMEQTVAL